MKEVLDMEDIKEIISVYKKVPIEAIEADRDHNYDVCGYIIDWRKVK